MNKIPPRRYGTFSIGPMAFIFGLLAAQVYGLGFDAAMHEYHRIQLFKKLDGGMAIIMGADHLHTGSYTDRFRQNSNFFYLTGYEEPGAALLLLPGRKHEFILFVETKDPHDVLWNGKRHGVEEVIAVFNADTAYAMDHFERILTTHLPVFKNVYCDLSHKALMQLLLPGVKKASPSPSLMDVSLFMEQLRVVKNQKEVQRMQKAIDITCNAHRYVMQAVHPGMYEYQIEGWIDNIYKRHGSRLPAFTSIIASGPNANVLHYTRNDRKIEEQDLLLLDIGADYGHYAADVTRTIPVSGVFSENQKEIYRIVLEAQQKALDVILPGMGIDIPGKMIRATLGEGLHKVGLISDTNAAWQVQVWQMHGTSHWLGLDVHDTGPYSFGDPHAVFQPGMILTVEPGVYISEYVVEHLDVFFPHIPLRERQQFIQHIQPALARYLHIGIRIEDDVLVTGSGKKVLSSSAPKQIDEIERLMATEPEHD